MTLCQPDWKTLTSLIAVVALLSEKCREGIAQSPGQEESYNNVYQSHLLLPRLCKAADYLVLLLSEEELIISGTYKWNHSL